MLCPLFIGNRNCDKLVDEGKSELMQVYARSALRSDFGP